MKNTLVALLCLLTAIVAANDQEDSFDPRDANDLSDLLKRKDVRRELEIVDDQIRAFRDANRVAIKTFEGLRAERANLTPKEELQRAEEIVLEMKKAQTKARQATLLPHQLHRLEQLRWQYQAMTKQVETFDRAVDLTEEQKKKMSKKVEEIREDLIEMMWVFHRRSQFELMEMLTPKQKAEWKRKVGAEFKFESKQWRGLSLLQSLR